MIPECLYVDIDALFQLEELLVTATEEPLLSKRNCYSEG